MAEGRQRDAWAHTSAVLALTANCNRDPKKRALTPDDFNPFAQKKTKQQNTDLETMRAMFAKVATKGPNRAKGNPHETHRP